MWVARCVARQAETPTPPVALLFLDDPLADRAGAIKNFLPAQRGGVRRIIDGLRSFFGAGNETPNPRRDDPVEWLSLEPDEGVVENGEQMAIVISVDFSDQPNGLYEAQLIFETNDPNNEVVVIPLVLDVGARQRQLTVLFTEGWNMISINVTPQDENLWEREEGPDVIQMLDQLRVDEDNHHIELFKDGLGHFYAPAWGFNNIPYWNLTEGYQAKADEDVEAMWEGLPIPADADVPLNPNWNIIAYFPTYELDAGVPDFYVLSPIIDFVVLAKNVHGQFLSPGFNFSNMPDWRETQGYYVKIEAEEPIVLNYPQEQEEVALAVDSINRPLHDGHWVMPVITGENMSVLVTSVIGRNLSDGDQISAFGPNGSIVGVGTIHDGVCGLAVWGDDRSTDVVVGLMQDEVFELRLWNSDHAAELALDISTIADGSGLVYEPNGFIALDMTVMAAVLDEFYLSPAYPNPFNAVTRLTFGLPEASRVSIRVYDVTGRLVVTLVDSELEAGHHLLSWQSDTASAGVYLVRMKSGDGFTATSKLMLIK